MDSPEALKQTVRALYVLLVSSGYCDRLKAWALRLVIRQRNDQSVFRIVECGSRRELNLWPVPEV